jgi:peptide/nickel transport system permease protein
VSLVPIALLVASVAFLVIQLAPGSYADTLDHPDLTPAARQAIRTTYGLDRTPVEQYLAWITSALTGNLGTSYLFKEPVTRVIGRALPATALLAATALLLDLVLGFGIALAATRRPHGWTDRITTVLSLGVYGMPAFWIAGLLVLVFSLRLGWFPPSHMHSVAAANLAGPLRFVDLLHHLVLPAISLGVVGAAATARYLRSGLLETRAARFVVAARARGLSPSRVLWVHTLRPALLPVITLFGLSLPLLVSGSVVIEAVFSWPGMGLVLWRAAQARDVPLIMGVTLVGAAAVMIGNLVADLLYAAVDPRSRGDA